MKSEAEIARLIREISGKIDTIYPATVISVDVTKKKVKAKDERGVVRSNIRLNAAADASEDYFLEVPEDGSEIMVGAIGKDRKQSMLLKCSKLHAVAAKVGSKSFVLNKEAFWIDKIDIMAELIKTNEVVKALHNSVQYWAVAASDGGNALQQAYKGSVSLQSLQPGEFE